MSNNNPYIPMPVEISKIIDEVDTHDIKTFRFTFLNKEDEEKFQIPARTICRTVHLRQR